MIKRKVYVLHILIMLRKSTKLCYLLVYVVRAERHHEIKRQNGHRSC